MRGVDKREERGDGDGVDAVSLEVGYKFSYGLLVQRRDDAAVVRDALRNAAVHATHDQGLRLLAKRIIHKRTLLDTDLHNVVEAFGGNDADLCTLFLNQGVGGDRGSVRQIDHLLRGCMLHVQNFQNTIYNGNR